jgi:hypothetical protein
MSTPRQLQLRSTSNSTLHRRVLSTLARVHDFDHSLVIAGVAGVACSTAPRCPELLSTVLHGTRVRVLEYEYTVRLFNAIVPKTKFLEVTSALSILW